MKASYREPTGRGASRKPMLFWENPAGRREAVMKMDRQHSVRACRGVLSSPERLWRTPIETFVST